MTLAGEQVLMRIYLDAADRAPHTPTYERVVKAARHAGLAGATVLRGLKVDHKAFSIIEHVPVIIEIVDSGPRIMKFIRESLDGLMTTGAITLERAHVMTYRHGKDQSHPLNLGQMLEPFSTLPEMEVQGSMKIKEEGVLLRVFIGESDKAEGHPLYEAIVQKARQLGLAGATVLRGTEGFGAHSVVHKTGLLEMSTDLPIVIEIVDTQEKITALLPYLEQVVNEGMITMEHVMIFIYRSGS
jgi:PII-like signaling protein